MPTNLERCHHDRSTMERQELSILSQIVEEDRQYNTAHYRGKRRLRLAEDLRQNVGSLVSPHVQTRSDGIRPPLTFNVQPSPKCHQPLKRARPVKREGRLNVKHLVKGNIP
ncbi:unnamed protein product [Ixodes pacificus]